MPFRLSGLLLNRVDLVPDGANPDAHIVLFKSKEGRVPQKAKKKAASKSKTKVDTRTKSKQRGDEEEEEEEEDDVVTKSDDDEDEDDDAADDDEDAVDDEDDEEDTKKSKSKSKNKAKAGAKKAGKAAGKKNTRKSKGEDDEDVADDDDVEEDEDDEDVVKSKDDEDDEESDDDEEETDDEDGIPADVMKSLPRHVRQALAKQSDELKTLRKESRQALRMAKDERDRRQTIEFVEKAKTTIPTLPGTAAEKGEVLKAIQSLGPEIRKRITRLLKAGDSAMKSLLSETGRTRASDDEEDSPVAQLREFAADLQKASKGSLTKEQAFEKACQMNPDLFKQYKIEKRRRTPADVM